ECDPEGEHFLWFNWHFSGLDRRYCDADRGNYIPMNFGEAPAYYRRFIERVDVACIKTCPMDEHGYFNFGGAIGYTKAMTERASKIVVETCATMPYVFGQEESIHVSEVDHVIEGRNDRVVSINNTAEMDLQGQAASESAGHRHVSGTGGQLQFVRGAYASKGGKSFICMSSTFDKRGEPRSRIVPSLTGGNIVPTPPTAGMYVGTQYGHVR